MKKVYLSILLAGIGSSFVYGQYAPKHFSANQLSGIAPKEGKAAPVEKAVGVTFWSDDFSTPSNWTIDNSGQTGGAFGWTIDAVSDGWWSSAGINSTSGGNYAELSNGNAQTATQALDVIYTMTTANPIDLTTDGTEITLSFLQYGARFNDLQEIQISTNGSTFVTVGDNSDFPVLSAAGGSAYPNPSLKAINLASSIAGATQLWIRFRWTTAYPAFSTNPNVWITYGWYIDDVALTTNADYDLEVTGTEWGTEGLNYYQIPLAQVAPIEFAASVFNGGTQTMTNAMLNVDINSGAFTASSAGVSIPTLGSAELTATSTFTPSALGAYAVARTITSDFTDDIPANNTIAPLNFSVTNYIYARDNGVVSGSTSNGTDGFEAGNLFDIWQNAVCKAINVRLPGGASGATVGTEIYVKLYSVDNVSGDFVYEGESAPLVIASANLNTNLVMELMTPVDVVANTTYLAVVGAYGAGLRVSNAGVSEEQTSFFFDQADQTWYYQTSTPYVRMNFDPGVGIEENNAALSIGMVYPNPTSGETTVDYSLVNASDVTVEVVDITGKVVYSANKGTQVAGANQISFDASTFSNGFYYVSIATNDAVVTKKFIKK